MISTTLLVGAIPIAFNLFCSHSGEEAIFIPLILKPEYLGHILESATSTSIVFFVLSTLKSLVEGLHICNLFPL